MSSLSRRQFITMSLSGISLLLSGKFAPTLARQSSDTGASIIQMFADYTARLGIPVVNNFKDSTEARDNRLRINKALAKMKFTLDEYGEPYRDYLMVSDLTRYRGLCVEHYAIMHENFKDVVVPLITSNDSFLGTASIVGLAFASEDYANTHPKHSPYSLASIFFPVEQWNQTGELAIFESGALSSAAYTTRNGTISITYDPQAESNAKLYVEAIGKIEYTAEYPLAV